MAYIDVRLNVIKINTAGKIDGLVFKSILPQVVVTGKWSKSSENQEQIL